MIRIASCAENVQLTLASQRNVSTNPQLNHFSVAAHGSSLIRLRFAKVCHLISAAFRISRSFSSLFEHLMCSNVVLRFQGRNAMWKYRGSMLQNCCRTFMKGWWRARVLAGLSSSLCSKRCRMIEGKHQQTEWNLGIPGADKSQTQHPVSPKPGLSQPLAQHPPEKTSTHSTPTAHHHPLPQDPQSLKCN